MSFFQGYYKEIISFLSPVVPWFFDRAFDIRPKLLYGSPHNFTHLLANNETAHTATYVIHNTGKKPANNVEAVFNWQPMSLNMWPVRHHTIHQADHGRYILVFDSLPPKDYIGFELLSVGAPLPELIRVSCSECAGTPVEMRYERVYSKGFINLLRLFLILGFMTLVYGLITASIYLFHMF